MEFFIWIIQTGASKEKMLKRDLQRGQFCDLKKNDMPKFFYFTDFASTQFFVQQGLMIKLRARLDKANHSETMATHIPDERDYPCERTG